jgi:hypothetical protein
MTLRSIGIGVRISVYLQAFICVISAGIRMWSDISHSPRNLCLQIWNGAILLLLGTAFVISGIIQVKTIGLAAFDALLILNINWIIITSVLMNVNGANSIFINWCSSDFTPLDLESDAGSTNEELQEEAQKTWEHYVTPMVIAQMLHFTLTSAFGLWFFFRLDSFDSPRPRPSCMSSTTYFLGRTVTVVNGAFRRLWKGIYFIGVIPGINIGIFGAVIVLVRGILNLLVAVVWIGTVFLLWLCGLIEEDMEEDPWNNSPWSADKIVGFIVEVTPPLIVIILLIVSMEKMIKVNLKEQDEDHWSFGQTLPLLCSVAPIWEVGYSLWKKLGFNKISLGRLIHVSSEGHFSPCSSCLCFILGDVQ